MLPASRVLAAFHPAAPPTAPHGSILPWLLAAALLAVVVAGGVYMSSRH